MNTIGNDSNRQNIHVANFIENSAEDTNLHNIEDSACMIDLEDQNLERLQYSSVNQVRGNNSHTGLDVDSEQQQSYFAMNFKTNNSKDGGSQNKSHYQISIKDCLNVAKGGNDKAKGK